MSVELEWPDGIEEISYEEFEQRVRDGKVPASTPVRFEVVTGTRFVPVEELELFQTLADPDIRAFRKGLRVLGAPIVTAILVGIQIRLYLFAQVGDGDDVLVERFANYAPSILEGAEVYRLLSYGLLQVGFTHLLVNLVFLAYVGWNLERGFGSKNLLAIFLFSIFSGGVLSMVMRPERPSLGSSGGDFGLLAAGVVFGWKHADMIPERARRLFGWGVFPYLVLTLGMGLRSESVDNWGHFGGLIGGGVLATLLEPEVYRSRRRPNRRIRRLALLGCSLVCLLLVVRGPRLLSTSSYTSNGFVSLRPTAWVKSNLMGGEEGWVSPTERAALVVRTASHRRPKSLVEAKEVILNELDAFGIEPDVVNEQQRMVGDLSAVYLEIRFKEAGRGGRQRELWAMLIPRGRLLHRVQVFVDVGWRWRYRSLAERLFSGLRVVEPRDVLQARQSVQATRAPYAYLALARSAAEVGFWDEAIASFEKVLAMAEAEDDQREQSVRGLFGLFRDLPSKTQPNRMADLAMEFSDRPRVQCVAAEALEANGEDAIARSLLMEAGQRLGLNNCLKNAFLERRIPIPEAPEPVPLKD